MEIPLREVQLIELDILKNIHKIAEKHNIKYYALGGTLLGAVRHNGFIPWDDDIDIGIKRSEYDLFLSLLQKELPSYIKVKDGTRDLSLSSRFAKVVNDNTIATSLLTKKKHSISSVFVDVFPIDGYPDDKKARWHLQQKHKLLSMTNSAYYTSPKAYRGIKKIISVIVPYLIKPDFFCKKINDLHKRYEFGTTAESCLGMYTWDKLNVAKTNFYSEVQLIKFEDTQIYATKYDKEYLTHCFGDYMCIPPANKRVSTHQMKFEYKQGFSFDNVFSTEQIV